MVRSSSLLRRSWIVLAFLAGMSGSSSAGFTIRDLGVIVHSGTSGAEAINASGQAAGMALGSLGVNVAVKTSGSGGFSTVGVPSGAVTSVADSINLTGQVAGSYTDSTGALRGFYTTPSGPQVINPLMAGGLSGTFTQANGINSINQVVGTGDLPGGSTRAFIVGGNGVPSIIAPLGTGTFNQGNGINDSGSVVGTSETAFTGPLHAFFTNPSGVAVDLGVRNPYGAFQGNTFGVAIANNGDIAGNGVMGSSTHAFFAANQGGSLIDLGLLPGASSSIASGLNQLSQEVGTLDYGTSLPGQPSSKAFVWDINQGMFDLNTLISTSDQANWVLTQATGINDSDQISGEGYLNGVLHGFVLDPIAGEPLFSPPGTVPEPPTVVLSMIGLMIAGAWAKLRRGRIGGREAA